MQPAQATCRIASACHSLCQPCCMCPSSVVWTTLPPLQLLCLQRYIDPRTNQTTTVANACNPSFMMCYDSAANTTTSGRKLLQLPQPLSASGGSRSACNVWNPPAKSAEPDGGEECQQWHEGLGAWAFPAFDSSGTGVGACAWRSLSVWLCGCCCCINAYIGQSLPRWLSAT